MMGRTRERLTFVSMVDAVVCCISILIIAILASTKPEHRPYYVPQADLRLICRPNGGDPTQYEVETRTLGEEPSRLGIETLPLYVKQRLERHAGLSLRILIEAGATGGICRDAVSETLEEVRQQILTRARGTDAVPLLAVRYLVDDP